MTKKIATRYDQKMERRRIQAEKDAKSEKRFNLICAAAGVVIVGAIAAAVILSGVNKSKAIKDTYIKVGDEAVTRLEYDYYYNMSVNNYVSSYGQILSYMGLDVTKDYAEQPYTDTMSWKDAFDQMTVEQIIQTKALVDDANANGFSADLNENYKEFENSMKQGATESGKSISQFYRLSFGSYATKKNIEPFVKDNLVAQLYYEDLLNRNTPDEATVTAKYESDKKSYDNVSYRSLALYSDLPEDASEAQISEAMADLKAKAEAMEARVNAGENFTALCAEYANEADKETYQDAETDASLTENASYASTVAAYQDWLFDEGRAVGDVTVVADESSNRYYVIEFVERSFNETTNDTIKSTMSGEAVSEYLAGLTANYEVTDIAGELVYLTIAEATVEAETAVAEEIETIEETIE